MSDVNPEQWAACAVDNRYEVSTSGLVRRRDTQRIRKPSNGGAGYCVVVLSTPCGHVAHYIHQLVLSAFIGPRPSGYDCSHLNGNRKDNRLVNLRYESHTDNMRRRHEHGTHFRGEQNPSAKIDAATVIEIRAKYAGGKTLLEIGLEHGISLGQTSRIVRRENWSHLAQLTEGS